LPNFPVAQSSVAVFSVAVFSVSLFTVAVFAVNLSRRLVHVDLHLKKPMYHYAAEEDRAMAIVNESVPIQLAQCWFRGLAISIFQC